MPVPLKIAYYGNCWMTNLGEAFIDIGAMELLKQALPESDIIFVTPMSHYYNNAMRIQSPKILSSKEECFQNAAHLGLYINADVFVMSGMFATEEFLRTGSATYWIDDFLKIHPDIKVLFMGIGGQKYTQKETRAFLEFIRKKTNLAGFVSRDNETYKLYKDLLPNCYPGIDCAFFVNDVYDPRGFSAKDYIVSTFINMPEPDSVRSFKDDIIRPQHMFYGAKYNENIKNLFISDAPYDYLSLYANAKEVHTDLVHATIVSLTYNIKVKYYHDSKRSSAFEAAGAIKDDQGYLHVPRETLNVRKLHIKNTIRKLLSP
jgi:hypothetical protein